MNNFDLIKTKISIFDVVSNYVTLKKAGIYWKGRCPFHHEKTASFTVSPHKDIFYCFGCQAGGDIITFVAKMEQSSPLEALQSLAERYNITLDQQNNASESGEHNAKQRFFELNKLFATWTHEQLLHNKAALSYLASRGLDQKSIINFELGYLPSGLVAINQCTQMFRTHHFLVTDLINANIILRGKTVLYSPFEDRIIFPIKDYLGRFCGFGGRIFKPADTRPKYYNSRENDYFIKGSILFGLDTAKKTIQDTGIAILVEGYTDCIAMVQHGYTNTIATLGTACTAQHLKILARYAHTLLVLYDGDTAGKNAVFRLAQLCWQANMELKTVTLPSGTDPASYLHSGNSMAPLIEQAREILLFLIESFGDSFTAQPLGKKMAVLNTILPLIASVDEPLKQDILLQRAAAALTMPFETLKKEMLRATTHRSDTTAVATTTEIPVVETRLSTIEQRLFCAIVNDFSLLHDQNGRYIMDYMNEPLRGIVSTVIDLYQKDPHLSFKSLYNQLDPTQQNIIIKIVAAHDEQMSKEQFGLLVSQLQKEQWRMLVKVIQKQLAHAQKVGNQEEMKTLLQQFVALKQQLVNHNAA
jgi:DNA primase